MNHDVHEASLSQGAEDLPPRPAEACTELEFSELKGNAGIEPIGRMERCLATMRRWLGADGMSTEN